MSVINKMLKDLDERKLDESEAQSQHNQANFIAQQKTPINWMLLVMLLILIALAFIGWQLTESKQFPVTELDTSNSSSNTATLGNGKLTSTDDIGTGKSSTKTALNETQQNNHEANSNPVRSENVQNSTQVAALPENPQQPSLGQSSVAETQLNDRTNSEIANDRNRLDAMPSKPVKPALEAENNKSNEAKEPVPVTQVARVETNNSVNSVNDQQPTPLATISAENAPQNGNPGSPGIPPKLVIERSNAKLTPEQQVNKLMAKAEDSFEKGYITEGISQLEQVLTISDMHVEARNMLAGAWYGRGEVNRAISILNNGLQRYPANESWRLTAAKIFFKENNPAGALSYLDVELTSVSKEFLTMKGSLGRQLQQFDKSESAYSKLAEMEPTVGNWWLGLAIAQDSLGKHQQALISYQNLVRLGGVSSDSMAFAKQRITDLKG